MPRRRTPEEYDEEIRQLREQRRAAVAREHAEERKAENHAKFVAGGLLLSCFPDGWQSVDWQRLADKLREENNRAVIGRCRYNEPLATNEASKRLREWEKHDRDSKK